VTYNFFFVVSKRTRLVTNDYSGHHVVELFVVDLAVAVDVGFVDQLYGISSINLVSVINTAKPAYNDCPWDPKIVAVVDSWSFFRGQLCSKSPIWDGTL